MLASAKWRFLFMRRSGVNSGSIIAIIFSAIVAVALAYVLAMGWGNI
jgi:hypothetical protein